MTKTSETAVMQKISTEQAFGKKPVATNESPALRQIKNLPGPRAWPLVGNTLQVEVSRIHQDMEQWCLRYGPLFRVYLGRRPMLVVANHATVSALPAAGSTGGHYGRGCGCACRHHRLVCAAPRQHG